MNRALLTTIICIAGSSISYTEDITREEVINALLFGFTCTSAVDETGILEKKSFCVQIGDMTDGHGSFSYTLHTETVTDSGSTGAGKINGACFFVPDKEQFFCDLGALSRAEFSLDTLRRRSPPNSDIDKFIFYGKLKLGLRQVELNCVITDIEILERHGWLLQQIKNPAYQHENIKGGKQ